jgi:hypothetical protein
MVELNLMVWRALKEEQQSCIKTNPNSRSLSAARKRGLVCVTSGNSYLASHIVKELLAHAYSVRVTIQHQGISTTVSWIKIYLLWIMVL